MSVEASGGLIHSGATWRVIRHGARTGAENMAIDEAIASSVGDGSSPPTLRLYAWDPPCVSLGRYQRSTAVRADRRAAAGIDIVRRPTGGRAILHDAELTYSVAARDDDPLMAGPVLTSYLRLAEGLLAGLRALGIDAALAPGTNRAHATGSAACFDAPSAYEILANGRKLIGSAQARKDGFVLQHGSLPLRGDQTRIVDLLALPSAEDPIGLRQSLDTHATSVEQILGAVPSFDAAGDAFAAGFAQALGLRFAPGELTATELDAAAELVAIKYGSETWTEGVGRNDPAVQRELLTRTQEGRP